MKTVILLVISNIFMTFAWYGRLRWNHLAGFSCMVLAVFFVFKKW